MPDLNELLIQDYRNKKRENISSDRAKELHEWLEAWLESRFDGDYFKMPKQVRMVHFASAASELMMLLDLELSLEAKRQNQEQAKVSVEPIDRDAEVSELNAFIQKKAPAYSVKWNGVAYEVLCADNVHYRRPTAEQVRRLCE